MKYIYLLVFLLIGTNFQSFSQTLPTTEIYNTSNTPMISNAVSNMAFDKVLGNLWVVTYDGGLYKFDGTNWTIYTHSNSGLPTDSLSCIDIAPNGDVWIGTGYDFVYASGNTGKGIIKFDGTNFTVYNTSNSSLHQNSSRCIKVDNSGKVWVGSSYGISKFNGTTWENHIYPNVKSIDVDNTGIAWVKSESSTYALSSSWTTMNAFSLGGNGGLKLDNNNNVWTTGTYNNVNHTPFLRKFNGSSWVDQTSTLVIDTSATNSTEFNSSVDVDDDNNIWFGSSSLFKHDGTSITKYNYSNVWYVASGNNGDMWIYSLDVGIMRIHKCVPTIAQQPQNQSISNGGTTTLTFLVGQNSTYKWEVKQGLTYVPLTDNNVYSGTNTSTLTIINPSTTYTYYKYHCIADDNTFCRVVSNEATVTMNTTAINGVNDKSSEFILYPNPVLNTLEINSPIKVDKVEVMNLVGEIMHTKYSNNKVDLSELSTGIYFVRINSSYTYKIIKQ